MSLLDENRRDLVAYRIERAFRSVEQAKANLQLGYFDVTANRLYYAAHYAVSALLIANQIITKSHDGTIGQFGLHFVKTGIFPREMGQLISNLFSMRQTGDYGERIDATNEEIASYVKPTEDFVKAVTALAQETLTPRHGGDEETEE